MTKTLDPLVVDLDELRASVRAEYAAVATEPDRGFHFHTGYRLAAILGAGGLLADELRELTIGAGGTRGAGIKASR
jgi:hypothetical protein